MKPCNSEEIDERSRLGLKYGGAAAISRAFISKRSLGRDSEYISVRSWESVGVSDWLEVQRLEVLGCCVDFPWAMGLNSPFPQLSIESEVGSY